MLGEFKCDLHVFVHLFRKKLLFDKNDATEILSTQVRTFLANLLQTKRWKCHARRKTIIFGLKFLIFPKIQTFQLLKLLKIII